MNRSKKATNRSRIENLRKALFFSAFLAFAWQPLRASASDAAKNTSIGIGGEFNRFSMGGFAERSGASILNLNLSLTQRVHPDVWIGLSTFLGHDPNPVINRNYDQNVGLLLHWFPWSLSTDSAVSFEGMQLSESETFRHFASTNVVFGRVLLRTVLDNFDASSDYVGLGLGMGSQYVVSPGFALSASLNYQRNIGTSPIAYSGQKIAVALGVVLGF